MGKLDTTLGEDMPITVHYDLERGQREILYPTDKAQEGIPPTLTITSVETEAYGEMYDFMEELSKECIERLTEYCWHQEGENGR